VEEDDCGIEILTPCKPGLMCVFGLVSNKKSFKSLKKTMKIEKILKNKDVKI
jgi:hypothetical protein